MTSMARSWLRYNFDKLKAETQFLNMCMQDGAIQCMYITDRSPLEVQITIYTEYM